MVENVQEENGLSEHGKMKVGEKREREEGK